MPVNLSDLLRTRATPAAVAVLLLLVLLPYHPLVTMQGVVITDDIFASDIMNDAFPYRFTLGQQLREGELPLWYPPVYGGFPLLARAEAGAAYPPNLLLFGLLPPYVALNCTILLTLLTAAGGMFLLARRFGADPWSAALGGFAFAFSGFMVAHLKHLSTVNSASWLPLALWFLDRGLSPRRDAPSRETALPLLGFAAVFGLQNLAGHTQTAYYSGLLYCSFFLFRFLPRHWKRGGGGKRVEAGKRKGADGKGKGGARQGSIAPGAADPWYRDPRLAWFAVALLLAAGLSALQVIPTYELVSLSQRAGGVTYEYASRYAYEPANAINLLVPYARGDIGAGTYRGSGIFWEDYGYTGAVTLALALFALVALRSEPHVRFFAVAAVAAFLLVLGPATPVYEAAFTLVPGMKYFRFPTRFLLIVNAAICLLGALGASRIASRFGGGAALLLLALVSGDLIVHQVRQNPVIDVARWADPPATARRLAQDAGLFRIYSVGGKETHQEAFARARGWQGDLTPYVEQREFLQPSLQVLYGLSSADGYAQLTPTYVVDIWGDQNRGGLIYKSAGLQGGVFAPRRAFVTILSTFNVKYLLSPWPVASPELPLEEAIGPVFLHRNASVLPRARLAGAYRLARSAAETEAALLDESFEPVREVVLAEQPSPVPSGDHSSSRVELLEYRSNSVRIRTAAASPGLLVLADTWYPGWRALVDGVERPILRANSSQRAVALDAGEHEVLFTFESAPARAGMALTGVSLLVLVVLVLFLRRGRR